MNDSPDPAPPDPAPPDVAAWTCRSTSCGARKTFWASLYLRTTRVRCSATRSLITRTAAGVVALQTGVGGRRGDVPGDLGSARPPEHQPFPIPIVGTDGLQGRHGARSGVDQGAGAGGGGLGTRTVVRPDPSGQRATSPHFSSAASERRRPASETRSSRAMSTVPRRAA